MAVYNLGMLDRTKGFQSETPQVIPPAMPPTIPYPQMQGLKALPFYSPVQQQATLQGLGDEMGRWQRLSEMGMSGQGGFASPFLSYAGAKGTRETSEKKGKGLAELSTAQEKIARFEFDKAKVTQDYITKYKTWLFGDPAKGGEGGQLHQLLQKDLFLSAHY